MAQWAGMKRIIWLWGVGAIGKWTAMNQIAEDLKHPLRDILKIGEQKVHVCLSSHAVRREGRQEALIEEVQGALGRGEIPILKLQHTDVPPKGDRMKVFETEFPEVAQEILVLQASPEYIWRNAQKRADEIEQGIEKYVKDAPKWRARPVEEYKDRAQKCEEFARQKESEGVTIYRVNIENIENINT